MATPATAEETGTPEQTRNTPLHEQNHPESVQIFKEHQQDQT